jgi:molecular chaperone DnaJ
MRTTSTCPTCQGEGQVIANKCRKCNGSAWNASEEVISINIPAGVAEGMQLSVSGRGNAAERGGIPGDLLVVIEEEPHAHLQRDGNQLLYDLYISFPEASAGTSVEIPNPGRKSQDKNRLRHTSRQGASTERERLAFR